jgi:hypothetical protein
MTTAALPYPIGINVLVFRDDGQWDNYRQWFLRTQKQIEELLVARITLGHYTDTDEPAYSHSDWVRKASELVATYPDCVFVYGANERD